MKIAHIVSTYPPYYGGMGNVVFEMASGLSAHGHEVQVFTPEYRHDNMSDAEEKNFDEREDFARRLRAPIAYGNAAYLPQLDRELDSFDLVHLHYPFFGTASIVARWKKRNPHKPLVLTYHMDTRANGLKGIFFKWYAEWFMPSILNSADLLHTASLDYLTHSDANSLYRETQNKWIEIPFGVDIRRFSPRPKPAYLIERYRLDPALPTIVFVGGMDTAHYFKGVEVLLQALSLLNNEKIPFQAVMVGEGNLREEFTLHAEGMGIGSQVTFAGRVPHDELPDHYALADTVVLPSTTQGEAFGMVLLEALASGVPVIASDLPGVRTIALKAGEVFSPGNAHELAQLCMSFFAADKYGELRDRARAVAEREYAWDRVISELEKQYLRLVA